VKGFVQVVRAWITVRKQFAQHAPVQARAVIQATATVVRLEIPLLLLVVTAVILGCCLWWSVGGGVVCRGWDVRAG